MDPPDLLSVELSTSRPTQHLGRMKSKSPLFLGVSSSLATLSLLFYSGDSQVRAAGGTAESLALARRGVRAERQLYPPRRGSLGWSCPGPAASASSSLLPPSLLTRLFRSWLPLLTPVMLFSPKPTPRTPLWAPSQPVVPRVPPPPDPVPVILEHSCSVPPPHSSHLPLGCAFAHSCSSLSPSLSLLPLSPSLSPSKPFPLSGSYLPTSPLPCLAILLLCLPCPHGLSYRGASTSPTSACHLHSQ